MDSEKINHNYGYLSFIVHNAFLGVSAAFSQTYSNIILPINQTPKSDIQTKTDKDK